MKQLNWVLLHPRATMEHLGYLPQFVSEDDPRPVREQFNQNYAHGGGWNPRPNNPGRLNIATGAYHYPDDPVQMPMAFAMCRSEKIYMYPHAVIAIVQPDGSYEIARMD